MNWVLGGILGTAALLLAVTLGLSVVAGKRGRLMSYLYMLTGIFGAFRGGGGGARLSGGEYLMPAPGPFSST